MKTIKAIDFHSHLGTEKGWPRTKEELVAIEKYYGEKVTYKTESEIAEIHRNGGVKTILASTTSIKSLEQIRQYHDYVSKFVKEHKDTFLGAWAQAAPHEGLKGFREAERALKELNMFGIMFNIMMFDLPVTDKALWPFYELCIENHKPALIYVGTTGLGAGRPGGAGIKLDWLRPVPYLDSVAADFPELTIIASRVAWPWDNEMIMVLLHKANVYQELHGWSPKYFKPELKREINGRLQDRFLYGNDYPLLPFERVQSDWENEGFKPEVLKKVYLDNAKRIFKLSDADLSVP